jgi:predicted DNA-binding transcriptional regulator AlpA
MLTTVPPSRAVAWPSTLVLDWMRSRVVAAGGDPADIPPEPAALWRLPEVERRTGYSRPTLYRLAARGEFPRPIPLRPSTGTPAQAA